MQSVLVGVGLPQYMWLHHKGRNKHHLGVLDWLWQFQRTGAVNIGDGGGEQKCRCAGLQEMFVADRIRTKTTRKTNTNRSAPICNRLYLDPSDEAPDPLSCLMLCGGEGTLQMKNEKIEWNAMREIWSGSELATKRKYIKWKSRMPSRT